MTNKGNEDLKNSTKCCIYGNCYILGNVKVKVHFHVSGKYRNSAHRDCNIKEKLNHKSFFVSRNLRNYDPNLSPVSYVK